MCSLGFLCNLRLEVAVCLWERHIGSHSSGFGSRIESSVVLSHFFFYEIFEFNLRVGRPVLLSEQAIKTLDGQSQLYFGQYPVMSLTCYMILLCLKALSRTSIEV